MVLLTSLSILLFCLKHLLNIAQRSLLLIFLAVHRLPLCTCYPVQSTSSPKPFLKLLSRSPCDFHAAKAPACALPVVCSVLSVALGTDVIPSPLLLCSSPPPPSVLGFIPNSAYFRSVPLASVCPPCHIDVSVTEALTSDLHGAV